MPYKIDSMVSLKFLQLNAQFNPMVNCGSLNLLVLITLLCRNVLGSIVLKCFLPFSEAESDVTEVTTENGLEDIRPSTGESSEYK